MRYMDAFKIFSKHPKWGMQLLLHSVCLLIPFLGIIVLFGHYIDVMTFQRERGEDTWPEFDFNRFGEYLGTGIWPFVTSLLVALIALPFGAIALAPLITIPAMNLHGPELAVVVAAAVVLYLALILAMLLIQVPMLLASSLHQSVGAAFSWHFIRGFVGRVVGPILLMHLFLVALSIPLTIAGYLTCGLGLYPAMAILLFTQWQLYRQVYELYLERGGTPIAISDKLSQRPAEPTSP
jgi:hypothetical protein